MPSTIVTGSTTRIVEPNSARRSRAADRGRGPRAGPTTPTSPTHDQHRDQDLGHGEEPDRVADPRPDEVEHQRPEGEADQEDRRGYREDVRRVAGPRGQQPGPQHLVAERRQAGDEGDRQGEAPSDRAPARPSDARRRRVVRRHGLTATGAERRRLGAASVSRAAERHDARRWPSTPRRPAARRVRPNSSIRTRPAASVPEDRADRVRRVQPPERLAQVRVRR